MTERIEAQIERFAPGFRDLILARSTFTAVAHGGAQPELRRRRHQRRCRHAPPDGLPADARGGTRTAPRHEGRLPVLRRHAARRWRARHVRPGGGSCRAARPGPGGPARRDLMSSTMAYAWYRLRSTLRSELSYFLSVILLVGAVGGLALGAIEAARSTESSFADFVDGLARPAALRLRRRHQPGHRPGLGLQPLAAPDAVPPARRGAGREHRGAQHGPVDRPRASR